MDVIKLQKNLWQLIVYCGIVLLFFPIPRGTLAHEQTASKLSSSIGKDFFIGFMKNFGGTQHTSLRLTIGTTYEVADVIVESQSGVIYQGVVSSSSPISVEVPAEFQVTNSEFSNREKGLHVYTANNSTIFIIAENYISRSNHGVFLAYPCLTFETETGYEYVLTSVSGDLESLVLLVGCENETEVSIIPSQSISLPQDFQLTNSTSIVLGAESMVNGLLHQMQTLLISSNNDLTGTRIVSNKPLTVIAGHECAVIPPSVGGCEPFALQIPPTLTWGMSFLLSPLGTRVSGTEYELVTVEETSIVLSCGNNSTFIPTTITASSIQFSSNEYCSLLTSKPVLVVQFVTASFLNGISGPALTLIAPTDQYVNEISFITLPGDLFFIQFISVTVQTEHFDESRILLDGERLDCQWTVIYKGPSIISGYGCIINISSWTNNSRQHVLSHSDDDGLISVAVYGFNSFSGYAYLGGQLISAGNGVTLQPPPNSTDLGTVPQPPPNITDSETIPTSMSNTPTRIKLIVGVVVAVGILLTGVLIVTGTVIAYYKHKLKTVSSDVDKLTANPAYECVSLDRNTSGLGVTRQDDYVNEYESVI